MRGPHIISTLSLNCHRITPACAGTTHAFYFYGQEYWDHPRLCGDHNFHEIDAFVVTGSPPPVRGPPKPALQRLFGLRITPACAGTT